MGGSQKEKYNNENQVKIMAIKQERKRKNHYLMLSFLSSSS